MISIIHRRTYSMSQEWNQNRGKFYWYIFIEICLFSSWFTYFLTQVQLYHIFSKILFSICPVTHRKSAKLYSGTLWSGGHLTNCFFISPYLILCYFYINYKCILSWKALNSFNILVEVAVPWWWETTTRFPSYIFLPPPEMLSIFICYSCLAFSQL